MDTIQAIRERRAINFFEPGRTLPDSVLNELLGLANLAPSSFDLQPWKVIAVRDPERKKTLRECAMNQQKVEDAAAVLIMVADPDGVEENKDRVLESWQDLGFMKPEARSAYSSMMDSLYGARGSLARKLFAAKNTSLYAMTLMIAAKGMGLDTHPMDGFDEACLWSERVVTLSIPAVVQNLFMAKGRSIVTLMTATPSLIEAACSLNLRSWESHTPVSRETATLMSLILSLKSFSVTSLRSWSTSTKSGALLPAFISGPASVNGFPFKVILSFLSMSSSLS